MSSVSPAIVTLVRTGLEMAAARGNRNVITAWKKAPHLIEDMDMENDSWQVGEATTSYGDEWWRCAGEGSHAWNSAI